MADSPATHMASEIRETPDVVERLLSREGAAIADIGRRLAARAPALFVTCARGSSDHAAGYFKYLSEIRAGVPVASMGPSIGSIYRAPLKLSAAVLVSVSQSGRSPDIVALQGAAREAGALAIAVVNQEDSPLAEGADAVVPLHAGVEKSVAATKSCIASGVALAALEALVPATSTYVIGRGPALPVAAEAALKLKETAVLHAEAFSGAEVMHGPLQLLQPGYPVIAFSQPDLSREAMQGSIERLRGAGGRVFEVSPDGTAPGHVAVRRTGSPMLDPLAMLVSFYGFAERLSRARGHHPDRPSLLRKVTETV